MQNSYARNVGGPRIPMRIFAGPKNSRSVFENYDASRSQGEAKVLAAGNVRLIKKGEAAVCDVPLFLQHSVVLR
jgi:hypothetical protein